MGTTGRWPWRVSMHEIWPVTTATSKGMLGSSEDAVFEECLGPWNWCDGSFPIAKSEK